MEMMWGVLMVLLCGPLASGVSVDEIHVSCDYFFEETPESDISVPSPLADLKATVTLDEERYVMNVSWAIAVDNSLKYNEGLILTVKSMEPMKCEYDPPLTDLKLPDDQEEPIWFHHTVYPSYAQMLFVQAKNIPQPELDDENIMNRIKYVQVYLPPRKPDPEEPEPESESEPLLSTIITAVRHTDPKETSVGGWLVIGGILVACVVFLLFGFVTYKVCAARLAMRYKKVGPGEKVPPVPVLVVYPAGSSQFQWAVGALVEFLQQYGGCSVAVDMWQQGAVAKLGPMRWLLEQVQAAHTVLIVAPQPLPVPGASIPAAAQDLYPLTLNLVASQAKNSSELAKFWAVRLEASAALAPELRACRAFCLMKDLNKLCRCLHQHKQNGGVKIDDLLLRGNFCSGGSSEKLRAAVQDLNKQHRAEDQDTVGTFQTV